MTEGSEQARPVPGRPRRRRATGLLLAPPYAFLALCYLVPQGLEEAGRPYLALAWASMLGRQLLFHVGLLLLALAPVFAWRRGRRALAACVPALLVALGPALGQALPRRAPRLDPRVEPLRVLSANLLHVNRTPAPILAEIEEARADLVLLQEVTPPWQRAIEGTPALAGRFPHRFWVPRTDSFGVGILSRLPFRAGARVFPEGEWDLPQLRAEIDLAGRPVAVHGVHLLPPRRLDYVAGHRRMLAHLLERLRAEPLPAILSGDFNFTERSPQADLLAADGWQDAFDQGGWGRGTTWPVHPSFWFLPSLRLDHIYLRGGLACAECRTGTGQGSDHRPVLAVVGFAAP